MSEQRIADIHRLMDDLAESKAEIKLLRTVYEAAKRQLARVPLDRRTPAEIELQKAIKAAEAGRK